MSITGPNVQKVLNTIRSENSKDEDARLFDFDRILPYPKRYRDLDERNQEYQMKFYAIEYHDSDRETKRNALAREYGATPGYPWLPDRFVPGGYEWTCNHWGTKRNAVRVVLTMNTEGSNDRPLPSAFIEFGTAWSPPLPVIERLAMMFPDHDFKLLYFEGGAGFSGQSYWEQGIEKSHCQCSYNGPRGGQKP